jgi:aminoglycoside phosphotransferase (APT) family kinase protein
VTSALPDASVVGVAALTEHGAGRYDSAVADLDDGRRVVVRVATDADTAAELGAEARALRALTWGVRAQLPFAAPQLLGRTALGKVPAIVTDHLDGYRVEAAHVPPGRGAATSLGAAIAAVHALPESVARAEGLTVLTPDQVRADVSRLLDRVTASHHGIPVSLLSRWSRALAADHVWRFESVLTLGGTTSDAFLISDRAGVPTVTGLLVWSGLAVGDPAVDLRWLSSAPDAAADVLAAYLAGSARTPDATLRTRARLYAELEFAKWLVHGDDVGRQDVIDDAVALLTSLADTVIDDDLLAEEGLDVDDAIALLGRLPEAPASGADTSMQTDAFDPADTAFFDDGDLDAAASPGVGAGRRTGDASDPDETAPLDVGDWVAGDADAVSDADRASQAALRRWAASE